MAAFTEGAGFSTSANGKTLDPRLLDILKTAAQQYGMDVQATSGVQGRSTGTKNHPGGYAVDIKLIGPDGKALPNYQSAKSFPAYEKFAQTARVVQQAKYPELNNVFRWGGYFAGGTNPMDLMHFDINPTLHGAMAGGSWDGGVTSSYAKARGITTYNPGLGTLEGQRQVASIKQGLSGGPLPPMNIPQVGTAHDTIQQAFPRPMPSSIASAFAPAPVPRNRPITPAPPPLPRPRPSNVDAGGFNMAPPNLPLNAALPANRGAAYGPNTGQWGPTVAQLGMQPFPPAIPASGRAVAVPQSVGIHGAASLTAPAIDGVGAGPQWGDLAGMLGSGAPVPPPLPRGGIPGMIAPGNLNLTNRPVYFGNDGSYGTERSFSIGTDQGEVLIPQIVGGKLVSEQQAIDHYFKTGENLGVFKTPEAADAYATQLHQRNQGLGKMPVPMPGRPAALTGAPPAPVQAQPPQLPAQRPSAPVAQPQTVLTAGGSRVAVGIHDQGDHSVMVSDDGTGHAKVERIRGPMSIPGVIDPLREANANTIAGGMIRKMLPGQLAGNASNFVPAVTDNVKSAAVNAASNLGSSIGGMFGGLFGGAPKPVTWSPWAMPAFNAPRQVAPMPMSRPFSFFAQPQVAAPRVSVPAPVAATSRSAPSSNSSYFGGTQNAINDTLRTLGFNV